MLKVISALVLSSLFACMPRREGSEPGVDDGAPVETDQGGDGDGVPVDTPSETADPSPWVGASGYAMVLVPPGTFLMGSPLGEAGREAVEVQHEVRLTQAYWIGEAEVTQGLWTAVTGRDPSFFYMCGDACPVENVSWCEALSFANALSVADGLDPVYGFAGACSSGVTWDANADGYRLPTEAEWEMAARGGEGWLYSGSDVVADVAWYAENSGAGTHPVCEKQRNALGLCDASGNVREWVWDMYGDYPTGPVEDPMGGRSADRVFRGGAWGNAPQYVRVAQRASGGPVPFVGDYRDRYLGLRLVRSSLAP